MAYINTWKNIERGEKLLNARFDMNLISLQEIDRKSNGNIDRIVNGFYFGFMQGYKQALTEIRKAK